QRQQAVINALVSAGVDRKDISTTQVSLQPQYGPDSSAIVGYRAGNSIAVKIRELDSASNSLALIVTTGGDATRINSVNYSIDDDSQLVKDARARAFQDAKDRAQQYAQLSGLELGKVIAISESAGPTPPTPLSMTRAAAIPVPLEPGQQTVGFPVTVVWELT
ncbi:SIMPL domain-containing protein, partial [Mycobacterium sp.]|uniref:SIMPL domain-containing protein n=1 Tax=Mycobacterium sp. TaxID=1785 RepID=UPI002C99F9E8